MGGKVGMVEHALRARVLFARVGWMRFYAGPVPGDERPVGGGKYNKRKIGHEAYNFREAKGRLYGYAQPPMSSSSIALERIDPKAAYKEKLSRVLVVFFARHPAGGQVIVGWYKDAEVLRNGARHSPGKPSGHGYYFFAKRSNCILLPEENRKVVIPSGKGGAGQSNACYALAQDGSPKRAPWMQRALEFINDYRGVDLLVEPAAAAEKDAAAAAEEALARSKGQGFAPTVQQRRAIEAHAMRAAKKHFRRSGFEVEDVSARRSYDLHCWRRTRDLHVEVKGTTTNGDAIVLTHNEVQHACNPRNSCVLFILHSIRLNGRKALGGKLLVVEPWRPHQAHLTPINYTYRRP